MRKTYSLIIAALFGLTANLFAADLANPADTLDFSVYTSLTEAEEASTVEYLKTLSFVLKLKGDGSATATGTMMKTGDMPAPAGWTAKGDTVILGNAESSDSSQKMVLTLKDGKLFFDAETMGEETAKYFYLQKQ